MPRSGSRCWPRCRPRAPRWRRTPQPAPRCSINAEPATRWGETAKNLIGPKLNGLFGRTAGSVEGFKYSDANIKSGIVWSEAIFAEYIRDPKAKIPGTKMVYAGLKNDQQIADLTAFLKQYNADGKTP